MFKNLLAFLAISTTCFGADQTLLNVDHYHMVVKGNSFSNNRGCNCNLDAIFPKFTVDKLKEQGFESWQLAAEMESLFSSKGQIHAWTAYELAVLAGHPNKDIYVIIGEANPPKRFNKKLAQAYCNETKKLVTIWGK